MLSRKDTYPDIRHRGEQSIIKGSNHHAKEEGGLQKEPTSGITGSENFWSDMKRN